MHFHKPLWGDHLEIFTVGKCKDSLLSTSAASQYLEFKFGNLLPSLEISSSTKTKPGGRPAFCLYQIWFNQIYRISRSFWLCDEITLLVRILLAMYFSFTGAYVTYFSVFAFLGNPSHLVREATRVGGCPGSLWQEDRHEQRGSRAHPGQDALLRGPGRMVHQ